MNFIPSGLDYTIERLFGTREKFNLLVQEKLFSHWQDGNYSNFMQWFTEELLVKLNRLYDTEPGTELMSRLSFHLTDNIIQNKLDSKHQSGIGVDNTANNLGYKSIYLSYDIENLLNLYNTKPNLIQIVRFNDWKIIQQVEYEPKLGYKNIFDKISKLDVPTSENHLLFCNNPRLRQRDMFNLLLFYVGYKSVAMQTKLNLNVLVFQQFLLPPPSVIYPSALTRNSKSCDALKPMLFENTLQRGTMLTNTNQQGNLDDDLVRTIFGLNIVNGTNIFSLISKHK